VSAPPIRRRAQLGRFVRHFFEMCVPMCIGFAIGDAVYFAVAGLLGYAEPFRRLPELSLAAVTFNMTAPMAGWMLFRGMPRRATAEMSAAMVVLAVGLLGVGWLGIARMRALPLLAHGLMMPAMLVPMLCRLDVYTGRAARESHASPTRGGEPASARS
jgi:hypothetical protein